MAHSILRSDLKTAAGLSALRHRDVELFTAVDAYLERVTCIPESVAVCARRKERKAPRHSMP